MTTDHFNDKIDLLEDEINELIAKARELELFAASQRQQSEGAVKTDWRRCSVRLNRCRKGLVKALGRIEDID